MTNPCPVRIRPAGAADADRIANLHADSWQRTYRGAYADSYLDGDVVADRLAVWRERLLTPNVDAWTVVAEVGDELGGFAHVIFDGDPNWGALVDNLHVSGSRQRSGIGTALMREAAAAVRSRSPGAGLYLWVLEQNTRAQAFYEALGGRYVGRALATPPGGDPARLSGAPAILRYAWARPDRLAESAVAARG